MAPIVLPHFEQKALLEKSEDLYVSGVPPSPIHSTDALGNSTQETVSAPEWRWHILQEQVCGFCGFPVAKNLIFPHKQLPL